MANIALIADLKESRDMIVPKRINVQHRLSEIIEFANKVYRKEMKCELDFSGGDSIQGLFSSPSSALFCYIIIKSAIFPYEMRCGIGAGDIMEMSYKNSNMMDGPSYHNARNVLLFSKNKGYEILFQSDSDGDRFINQYLVAAQAFMSKQSMKQQMIFHLVSLINPLMTAETDMEAYNMGIHRFIERYSRIYGSEGEEIIGDYTIHNLGIGDCILTVPYLQTSKSFDNNVFNFGKKTINRSTLTTISKILGVSSENIRQMVIKGDIEMIRSLLVSASLAAQYFSGDKQ